MGKVYIVLLIKMNKDVDPDGDCTYCYIERSLSYNE